MTKRNIESFWTTGPHDPIDLGPWPGEVRDDMAPIFAEPTLALLVDPQVRRLLGRALTAPKRRPRWRRITFADAEGRELHPLRDEGWFQDMRTGEKLVFEDQPYKQDPYWSVETPFPEGAYTLGEMAGLLDALNRTAERFIDEGDAGGLTQAQRQVATNIAEAIENMELRLMIVKLQPTAEEAEALKTSAIRVLAGEDLSSPDLKIVENPKPAPLAGCGVRPAVRCQTSLPWLYKTKSWNEMRLDCPCEACSRFRDRLESEGRLDAYRDLHTSTNPSSYNPKLKQKLMR